MLDFPERLSPMIHNKQGGSFFDFERSARLNLCACQTVLEDKAVLPVIVIQSGQAHGRITQAASGNSYPPPLQAARATKRDNHTL